jgi:two-component system chemotaxis response regulator CheY
MERADFSAHRVLVLGAKTHGIQLICSILGIAGIGKVIRVCDARRALELLSRERFSAVVCDSKVEGVGGRPFIKAARRDMSMVNPMIPIFVFEERARRSDVERARDIGANDVVTTPISAKAIAAKLLAATRTPRPFIVAEEFFGPDRRAKARPPYFGDDRRKRAPRKAKVDFMQN